MFTSYHLAQAPLFAFHDVIHACLTKNTGQVHDGALNNWSPQDELQHKRATLVRIQFRHGVFAQMCDRRDHENGQNKKKRKGGDSWWDYQEDEW